MNHHSSSTVLTCSGFLSKMWSALAASEVLKSGDDTQLRSAAPHDLAGGGKQQPRGCAECGRALPTSYLALTRSAEQSSCPIADVAGGRTWDQVGHSCRPSTELWPPLMCSSKYSRVMGSPFRKPCARASQGRQRRRHERRTVAGRARALYPFSSRISRNAR